MRYAIKSDRPFFPSVSSIKPKIKIKVRIVEITFLNGTTNNNPTEFVEMRDYNGKRIGFKVIGILFFCFLWGLVGDV